MQDRFVDTFVDSFVDRFLDTSVERFVVMCVDTFGSCRHIVKETFLKHVCNHIGRTIAVVVSSVSEFFIQTSNCS